MSKLNVELSLIIYHELFNFSWFQCNMPYSCFTLWVQIFVLNKNSLKFCFCLQFCSIAKFTFILWLISFSTVYNWHIISCPDCVCGSFLGLTLTYILILLRIIPILPHRVDLSFVSILTYSYMAHLIYIYILDSLKRRQIQRMYYSFMSVAKMCDI